MRRGSPPCSPGVLASRLPPPLGDQLVHEAAPATSVPDLLLYSSQELTAGLEHYPVAIEPGRELISLLDAKGATHSGGEDESPLGSESKWSCHASTIMARL